MNFLTGRVIGNYRIVERLGEGGMGKVYRAVDVMVEREVALKALKPEIATQAGVIDRFRSEAVLLAKLNHPAIAQLYTFFKDGPDFYMVMEYVAGETLESVIRGAGAIPWQRALGYALEILEGIGHAHALGILHRDLKPANIVLTPAGKAKIMDFGIARALGAARMTREGRVIGTLEYLAPERIQGQPADVRSDLYSVGVLLYEMLAGRLPFQATSEYELLTAHVQQMPPSPRDLKIDIPPAVEAAVMKALAKDPADRYPDAEAFAAALRAFEAGVKETRLAEAPPMPAGRPTWPRPAIAGVAVLLLVASMTFGFVKLFHHAPRPTAMAAIVEPPAAAAPEPRPADPPAVILPQPIAIAVPEPSTPAPAAPAPKSARRERQPKPDPAPTVPAFTPDHRRAAISALEETDGPALGEPGARPIHLSGLVAALKVGGAPVVPEIDQAVAARGVNFLMTPGNEEALRQAGAPDQTVRLAAANYRAVEPAAHRESTTPSAPPKLPTVTARRALSLADVHILYVDAPDELAVHLREELKAQLGARFSLAPSGSAIDAVMRVTLESPGSGKISKAGRVLGFKDNAEVHAVILAPGSAQPLWQQAAGDRKPILGAFHHDSTRRLANRIVKDLKQDLH